MEGKKQKVILNGKEIEIVVDLPIDELDDTVIFNEKDFNEVIDNSIEITKGDVNE